MYKHNRLKQDFEINKLRCAPMDPRNLPISKPVFNLQELQPQGPLDPETITHQFQTLQYYNYMTYVKQMEAATGVYCSDPLGLNIEPSLIAHPPYAGRKDPNRKKTVKAEMTYGEYKRSSQPDYQPSNANISGCSTKEAAIPSGWSDDEDSSKTKPKDDNAVVISESPRRGGYRKRNDSYDNRSRGGSYRGRRRDDNSGYNSNSSSSYRSTKPIASGWSDDEDTTKPKPKDEGDLVKSGSPNRGGYQRRSDSYDNRSRGGSYKRRDSSSFRGRRRDDNSGYNSNSSSSHRSTKPIASGWSDDEDTTKPKPKDEGVLVNSGGPSRGGYQRRSDSCDFRPRRGNYRRDSSFRGRRQDDNSGYNRNSLSSFRSSKPIPSGWSDDEDSTKSKTKDDDENTKSSDDKPAAKRALTFDDDWDVDDQPAAKKQDQSEDEKKLNL